MAAQAQGVGLDEHRPGAEADFSNRGGERAGAAFNVGRIEREALHAVAGGAAPKLGAGGKLFADRRGVGVAVVFDDKQHRQREQRGKVQRLVHIARAGGTIAKEREADGGAAEPPLRIRGAKHVGVHRPEVADHRQ